LVYQYNTIETTEDYGRLRTTEGITGNREEEEGEEGEEGGKRRRRRRNSSTRTTETLGSSSSTDISGSSGHVAVDLGFSNEKSRFHHSNSNNKSNDNGHLHQRRHQQQQEQLEEKQRNNKRRCRGESSSTTMEIQQGTTQSGGDSKTISSDAGGLLDTLLLYKNKVLPFHSVQPSAPQSSSGSGSQPEPSLGTDRVRDEGDSPVLQSCPPEVIEHIFRFCTPGSSYRLSSLLLRFSHLIRRYIG